MVGRVLIVAGSDSGGGAGIQADIKTVTALGGFAMTAISAVTAQNTLGVQGIVPIPPDFVALQMNSVIDDLGVDSVKLGMLPDADTIRAVAGVLHETPSVPVILDPVMVASSGARLMEDSAVEALTRHLMARAHVVTPNLPEAEALTGLRIGSVDEMISAASALRSMGAQNVLVKGGHLPGEVLTDVLLTDDGVMLFEDARLHSRATHGTGCTLASAIAAGLARGQPLPDAVKVARAYVRLAIQTAVALGNGVVGPMNHAVRLDALPS